MLFCTPPPDVVALELVDIGSRDDLQVHIHNHYNKAGKGWLLILITIIECNLLIWTDGFGSGTETLDFPRSQK